MVALISRMVWVSSMTEMTESSDESFTMLANCPASAGSAKATSWGSTTWRAVCQRVNPTARAASICPGSIEA